MEEKTLSAADLASRDLTNEVRADVLFDEQLQNLLSNLTDPAAWWPADVRVRIDGPLLGGKDKRLFTHLLISAGDDCVAEVPRAQLLAELGCEDTDAHWASAMRSCARLQQAVVRMRMRDEVREARVVEEIAEVTGPALRVQLGRKLLASPHGRAAIVSPRERSKGLWLTLDQALEILPAAGTTMVPRGWPNLTYTIGKPLRLTAEGEWMVEVFGLGSLDFRGEVALRTVLRDRRADARRGAARPARVT